MCWLMDLVALTGLCAGLSTSIFLYVAGVKQYIVISG